MPSPSMSVVVGTLTELHTVKVSAPRSGFTACSAPLFQYGGGRVGLGNSSAFSVRAYVYRLFGPLISSLATGNASVLKSWASGDASRRARPPVKEAGFRVIGRTAFPRLCTLHET